MTSELEELGAKENSVSHTLQVDTCMSASAFGNRYLNRLLMKTWRI